MNKFKILFVDESFLSFNYIIFYSNRKDIFLFLPNYGYCPFVVIVVIVDCDHWLSSTIIVAIVVVIDRNCWSLSSVFSYRHCWSSIATTIASHYHQFLAAVDHRRWLLIATIDHRPQSPITSRHQSSIAATISPSNNGHHFWHGHYQIFIFIFVSYSLSSVTLLLWNKISFLREFFFLLFPFSFFKDFSPSKISYLSWFIFQSKWSKIKFTDLNCEDCDCKMATKSVTN